jgi:hypothetical protein
MAEPLVPDTYAQFLADMKSRIQAAQLHASLAVNRELVLCTGRSAAISSTVRNGKAGAPR